MSLILANTEKTELALAKAIRFLIAAQRPDGSWLDFALPAGGSNIWVTAYVADSILGCPGVERTVLEKAWRFLETNECETGGWSYNPTVPGDADSTLWGIRFAERFGFGGSDAAIRALRFFDKHLHPEGGVCTYESPDPIRNYIGLPHFFPFTGWTQPHVCVSAAATKLELPPRKIVAYLTNCQESNGKWPAYWWFDDEYSTSQIVANLGHTADARFEAAINQGLLWLTSRAKEIIGRTEDSECAESKFAKSEFALGCALQGLAVRPTDRSIHEWIQKAMARLEQWQNEDGSWGPSARLRVPRPDCQIPAAGVKWKPWAGMPAKEKPNPASILEHTFTNYSLDHHSIFSTATIVKAIFDCISPQIG